METPALHPFPYDAFQQQAIDVIERETSLLVAAPTGSGKTVLADYVIERSFARGQRVIYTSPIKALSNQKFRDFTARHGEDVGIMTGDVTINPGAPLVIMTTEIYRNALLEDSERLSSYAWIIFDEVHYLDDPERGTVWEEAILFTPPHIKLLCLSATVPNVEELAQWIRAVHQRPVEVIVETKRPVPLTVLFQCQNAILDNPQTLKSRGYLNQEDWTFVRHRRASRHRMPAHPNRLEKLVRDLAEHDRLPCIFFTFGRRRTEELAWELRNFSLLKDEERTKLRALFDELCDRYQLTKDRGIHALGQLLEAGVGFHHAGMLPTTKEVLERCFSSRLMKIIVTTETFALGVNMPARSVVLDTLTKRGDRGFELMQRRAFLQMAGRAGRRGMDREGFVYVRVNPLHVKYQEVVHLLTGKPEPVRSRFNTAYATLLNLYRRHGRGLLNIFPKTLYYAQTSGARRDQGLSLMERKLDLLAALGYLSDDGLTETGEFGSWVYGYELLLTELETHGALEPLDPVALAVLMVAVVYEPRPRTGPAKPHPLSKRLAELCQGPLARIHREEHRFAISPKTKSPAYHLTHAMEAWMGGADFNRISRLADVDEGELVRYFRMAVQLLRQLGEMPVCEPRLRDTARRAMRTVNRDVIDAEAQLRLGA